MLLDDQLSKRNAGQLAEELDAMGQESEEKAVKWVQEVENRNEKKRQETDARQYEVLDKKRRFKKNDYFESLLTLANRKIGEYDIPRQYNVQAILKDDRLIVGLQKIGYRWYAKGMKICGEPKYDINCVERLVVQCFLALDELESHHEEHRTKSGIVLPSKL